MVTLWWITVVIFSLIALMSHGVGGMITTLIAGWVLGLFVYE